MRLGKTHGTRRQRGGALIVVLVVLVLMAALSLEVAATAATHKRLAEQGMNEFLLRTAAEGRREILKKAIIYAKAGQQNVVKEDGEWAWHNHDTLGSWGDNPEGFAFASRDAERGGEDYSNKSVELTAWCEDERGKICLLGLVPKGSDDGASIHDRTRRILIRLIDAYREPWSDLDLTESDAEEMVDALIEFLHTSREDDEESPTPDVPDTLGRIQSIDDLRRIPGGLWTADRLYDVRDPEWDEEEDEPRRRSSADDEPEETEEGREDTEFFRPNGIPGLARFLTLHAQGGDAPQFAINFNTASATVIRALFDPQDEQLAINIVEHRRQGVGADDEDTAASGDEQQGFFENPTGVGRVDGFDENWQTEYPLAASFFATDSTIFSICIIAMIVEENSEQVEIGDEIIPPVQATFQYREIVEHVGTAGVRTRYVERRHDPYFDRDR